jgi:hypothetical protein
MFRVCHHAVSRKCLTGLIQFAPVLASLEMLRLITTVNSPFLGINFDTGNFVRLLDDPVKGMPKLPKYIARPSVAAIRDLMCAKHSHG